MEELFIPIGSNCSIAYNLSRLGLRQYSFPFDWITINLEDVISLISSKFSNFTDSRYLYFK